ncbi:hypothetical protein C900_02658 [Fulvivirga imtechensis AK7]|uniref:Putative auto-transporter adhesin head GIN domain-containing protein n=1 Tax=Fulvivirga imtechensis AK7 TaxID=1237149 RepID=L8JZI5_9BACT|nr:head GIN domain-containing protein [Fulvivirga imtechensis]ELR73573.1 hypothetical protein C900_02658 [Fulvivirga imtechensis AK7]
MKSVKFVIATLFFALVFNGVRAQEVEERNVGAFHEIRTGQAIDVYLKPGTRESVRVEAKGISLRDVLTEVSGGRLKIHLDHGRHSSHSVKVYVTFVKLDHISASSASGVFTEGTIKGDRLEINVSSAADVEVTAEMNEINVSVSSSGDLELKGRTKYLEISASSAGGVDAFDLAADNVRVRASSAGSAKVTVNKEIDAHASSGGSIRYRGSPERSQTDSSSGGSVRKSN